MLAYVVALVCCANDENSVFEKPTRRRARRCAGRRAGNRVGVFYALRYI